MTRISPATLRLATLRLAALGFAAASLATPAPAQELSGTWLRETGASRVRFTKCGDAFCGSIVWLKDSSGPSKVGQRIFFDMKPNGDDRWVGKAFNPEDGKTYSGKVQLNGNKLVTEGCALAGLVCRTVNWTKFD